MNHIRKLERITGRYFSSPKNSLLLSVRSGSAVSMPGMMNSFLNVGINERIVEGLIEQTKQAWFAWDNYRRFLQSWGMSFGMQRDEFDAMMNFYKKRYSRHVKREFMAEEIHELVKSYKHALKAHFIDFSEDPKEQLFTAIKQVVASWYSPKAETYRNIMLLSENWGTAVTIQTMVFGNLDTTSGAGVMFTHDPWTSEEQIYPNGDFTLGNQGEDVVGGLVKTLPLSEKQRLSQGERKEYSLESLFPKVYRRLEQVAEELIYQNHWSPQEIEFTFQGDQEDGLHILQSRNMSPRVRRVLPVFKPTEELSSAHVGSGIGVSGGALCGMVAFDLDSIQKLRKEHSGQPIILLRSDTVPDDIREISIADGILTGKGGATSHAAIVAHRLEKTCVVGFSKMKVWEMDRKCIIDGKVLRTGDLIGIDGRSGAIYLGCHETQHVDVV
jgi:pyruvate,orthophosphate dikinase